MCYHYRCHEQDSGKAHYLLSEQVVFHGAYLALVRLPIASMPPAHDARCTMHRPRYRLRGTLSLGGFCRWWGGGYPEFFSYLVHFR